MMFSAIFIAVVIVLEAGPVYILFMADVRGVAVTMLQWCMIVPAFILVLCISIFAVYKPMKMGLEALSKYE